MFSKKKLKIGYFTSLPYFPLVGDTEEIVLKAKSALESQGHTLVPFEMPDSFEMMNLVVRMIFQFINKCSNDTSRNRFKA